MKQNRPNMEKILLNLVSVAVFRSSQDYVADELVSRDLPGLNVP